MLFSLLLSSLVAIATPTPDPGWCGVPPFETGIWDPFHKVCIQHDKEFNAEKVGAPNDGFAETTRDFALGAAKVAAVGAYSVVMFLPYTLLATVVGGGLWVLHGISQKRE